MKLYLSVWPCRKIACVTALGTSVLIIETNNIFNRLDRGICQFAQISIHEIVSFNLADGNLRDFWLGVAITFP